MTRCDETLPGPQCDLEAGHEPAEVHRFNGFDAMPPELRPMFASMMDDLDSAIDGYQKSRRHLRYATYALLVALGANVTSVILHLIP